MFRATWLHWRGVTLRCLGSDMTALRCQAVLASVLVFVVLAYPDDTMARRGAGMLHDIFRDDAVLAAFFAIDALGLLWRIYDPISRPRAELVVNIFGFLLVLILVVSVFRGFGFYTMQSAIVTAVLASRFLMIVRSGNGPSEVGP